MYEQTWQPWDMPRGRLLFNYNLELEFKLIVTEENY